jgi:hypothetical protein
LVLVCLRRRKSQSKAIETDKQRSIKALTENIIMNVRSSIAGWSYSETHGGSWVMDEAVDSILSSLSLSHYHVPNNTYTSIILKAITEAIRIARMYDDLDSDDIVKAVKDAADVLRGDFN